MAKTKDELQAELDAALRTIGQLQADAAGRPSIGAGTPKDYVYRAYPKVLYHEKKKPRLVHDPDEQAALGDAWRETPFGPETAPAKPIDEADE